MKSGRIVYKSQSQGLKPLVFCLKRYKKEMRGAIVFDKIIGLAAAKLLAYGEVKEIWTPTVSKGARRYLTRNKIKIKYNKEVVSIMNRTGTDLCPMEKKRGKKG